MKITLGQILDIETIFQSLVTKRFSNFSTSLKIANYAKELNQHKIFYVGEEKKLIEQYADKDENGNPKIVNGNQVTFQQNPKALIEYQNDVQKLKDTEVDIFEPFELRETDFKPGELDLTPLQIIILSQCVTFIPKEEDFKDKEA